MIEMDISAIKFEAARLHFLSDVFVNVAVVVAQTPYSTMATGVTGKMTSIRSIFFWYVILRRTRVHDNIDW